MSWQRSRGPSLKLSPRGDEQFDFSEKVIVLKDTVIEHLAPDGNPARERVENP